MQAFRKLLVPVDFSAPSEKALRLAVDLARTYGASITLLHVYEPLAHALPEGHAFLSGVQVQQLYAELQKQLAATKVAAEGLGAGQVEMRLVEGNAPSVICEVAGGGFDLIVLASHGRTGLQRWLLGSVAERVVRSAPCPVLTVRALREEAA